MAPYNRASGWTPVLLEAAENVRSSVKGTLLERPNTGVVALKRLLDEAAQEAILETLRNQGVSANIVSEEGGQVIGGGGPHVVLDPVDGTTNLARGLQPAVTSLAVSETPTLSGAVAALVMDLYTGDVYRAERGRGAFRGSEPIHPAPPTSVRDGLISLDVSKSTNLGPIAGVLTTARHIRQLGCSAISICHVASGTFDAHIDIRGSLRATDAAAALIILGEAGGAYAIDGAVGGDLELSRRSRLRLVSASGVCLLDEIMGLTGRRS